MINGQNTEEPTLASAASLFERLSSAEENPETDEKTPTQTESPVTDDVENEPVEDDEESTSDTPDDEGEEPVEEEEESDEEQPEPEPKSKTRKIKVNGEEVEVTEEELEKGYSRTADYTRKTQAIAEKDRSLEAERKSVSEERAALANQLTQLRTAIESLTPQEPDWDKLREENPEEFAIEYAAWQQHKDRLAKLSAKEREAIEKVRADQQKHLNDYITRERETLLEKKPSWKDAEVAKKELGAINEYAMSHGYTENDLAQVADHRVILLLEKAMLYDRAQKAKPSVRQKIEAVRTATPGPSSKSVKTKNAFKQGAQRLRRSGSVQDAAALFELLDD